MTEPGRMFSTALRGMSFGAGRPGTAAVVTTTSKSGIRSSSAALLLRLLLGRELASRSRLRSPRCGRRGRGTRRRGSPPAPDGRPHVECRHDGAEPARGGDRLQPGDARADDERAHRRDRAGGGHEHGKEPRHAVGGEDDGLVSGDGRLRRERVHRLRARDPRDRLHRERDDAALAQAGDPRLIRQRLEEADDDGARRRSRRRARRTASERTRGSRRGGDRPVDELGARLGVGVVGEPGGRSRSALDLHLEARRRASRRSRERAPRGARREPSPSEQRRACGGELYGEVVGVVPGTVRERPTRRASCACGE